MCGRFENSLPADELLDFLEESGLPISNIAPTQKIRTLVFENGTIKMRMMNWGLKFSKDSHLIFNSRIETIKEKPFWQGLFDKNRCLVPMTAFYEWVTEKDTGRKAPYRIYLKDQKYFYVPALYFFKDNNFYASLITTTPNSFIQNIHHRMPVIIRPNDSLPYFTNDYKTNLTQCVPYTESEAMAMEKANL